MLHLLLDEHLSDDVAVGVRAHTVDIAITSLQAWDGGIYLVAPDDAILRAAYAQGLTLVTFDHRTIVPLLADWGERGIPHGGVIFGHSRTVATNDIGRLVRALLALWRDQGDLDWTNRVVYLSSP